MESGRKYELTDETISVFGTTVHRIKALRSFGDVKQGDLGGFIEKEENLSHDGNCWVYDNATVFDNAMVCDDARVRGYANVCDGARVKDHAFIRDHAFVHWNAEICDHAVVYMYATVSASAIVSGVSHVFGRAYITGHSHIQDNACIGGRTRISRGSSICGYTTISDDVSLDNVNISCQKNYIVFKGFGSRHRDTAVVKNDDGSIRVFCGCFSGNLDEFENAIRKRHETTRYAEEYLSCVNTAKIHFGIK